MTKRPWGINVIGDMFPFTVWTTAPGHGGLVRAVAVPYPTTIFERVHAAWWVLTGRAHAVLWPEPGDLEECLPGRAKP